MKALAHWRHYLGWTKHPFTVLTDHANLQYWKSPRNLNRRTARWHADLQEYDYEIRYIPGKTNVPPDALSRPPGADHGDRDNQNIALIPKTRFGINQVQTDLATFEKRALMAVYHDHPSAGHPGRDETLRQTRKCAQWPGMKQWVADYVKGCSVCQQNKTLTHPRRTPLYRITTEPQALPFQQVCMDLITGLPPIRGHDAILTIVDHGCSRSAIFLPCSTTITGVGIAQLYLEHVYRWFGLPTKLITDRDPRFTSHFGKALAMRLGIQQNLSMAFHPQTDGLSERKNQWVEQYLRLVTSSQPKDWSVWLPIATAVHNNRRNTTTGLSPNQILLGYETTLIPSSLNETNNQTALERTERMAQSRDQAIEAINRVRHNEATPPSQFKVNDQVWLDAKNLRLPYQTTKLAPKRYGPFRITKEISPVAYQLSLPISWTIHDVFHASLLVPYQENAVHGPNFSNPPPDLIQGAEEYEVEHLVNHQRHGRSRMLQYFVKWKGYPESDNTWEPVQNIHAPDLLKKYHQRYPLQDKREKKPKRKVSSQLRITALCRTLRTNPLPVNPTNSLFPPPRTTIRSPLPPNFRSMSLGKSSAKQPSATRRNRSRSHHARD